MRVCVCGGGEILKFNFRNVKDGMFIRHLNREVE